MKIIFHVLHCQFDAGDVEKAKSLPHNRCLKTHFGSDKKIKEKLADVNGQSSNSKGQSAGKGKKKSENEEEVTKRKKKKKKKNEGQKNKKKE